MTHEFKKLALSQRISEDISKAIGKMCNLERSTSASYLKQFLLRYCSRAFSTQYSIIYIVCHVISPFCRHTPQNRCFSKRTDAALPMRDDMVTKKFFHGACRTKFLRGEIPLWEALAIRCLVRLVRSVARLFLHSAFGARRISLSREASCLWLRLFPPL